MKDVYDLQIQIKGLRSYISSDFCNNPKDIYKQIKVLEEQIAKMKQEEDKTNYI